MKEEILAFLEWAENNRASSLFKDIGSEHPYCLWDSEVKELVDDYIKSQEEK